MKTYSLYCLRNTLTNEAYYGITNDVKRRANQHSSIAKSNKRPANKLYRAIREYGMKNFHFTEVLSNLSYPEACYFEIQTLMILENIGARVYNSNPGGIYANQLYGKDLTEIQEFFRAKGVTDFEVRE